VTPITRHDYRRQHRRFFDLAKDCDQTENQPGKEITKPATTFRPGMKPVSKSNQGRTVDTELRARSEHDVVLCEIYSTATRFELVRNHADAEFGVQETMVKAYAGFESLRLRGTVMSPLTAHDDNRASCSFGRRPRRRRCSTRCCVMRTRMVGMLMLTGSTPSRPPQLPAQTTLGSPSSTTSN
jgi:hypothetical protein